MNKEQLAGWCAGMERAAAICRARASNFRTDDPVEAEHKMEATMCAMEILNETLKRFTAQVEKTA